MWRRSIVSGRDAFCVNPIEKPAFLANGSHLETITLCCLDLTIFTSNHHQWLTKAIYSCFWTHEPQPEECLFMQESQRSCFLIRKTSVKNDPTFFSFSTRDKRIFTYFRARHIFEQNRHGVCDSTTDVFVIYKECLDSHRTNNSLLYLNRGSAVQFWSILPPTRLCSSTITLTLLVRRGSINNYAG